MAISNLERLREELDNQRDTVGFIFLDVLNDGPFTHPLISELAELDNTPELQKVSHGEWKMYAKGSDPKILIDEVAGAGWFIDHRTSKEVKPDFPDYEHSLNEGDIHVFFSHHIDESNTKVAVPRAIFYIPRNITARFRWEEIIIQGIDSDRNLDPFVVKEVHKKLLEFGDHFDFKNANIRMLDTRKLLYLAWKKLLGEELSDDPEVLEKLELEGEELFGEADTTLAFTKKQLSFLYENPQINSYLYDDQDILKYLRKDTDKLEVAGILSGVPSEDIATNLGQITDETRTYVGPLSKDVFVNPATGELRENLKFIYRDLPGKQIIPRIVPIIRGKKAIKFQIQVQDLGLRLPSSQDLRKKAKELGFKFENNTLWEKSPKEAPHAWMPDMILYVVIPLE